MPGRAKLAALAAPVLLLGTAGALAQDNGEQRAAYLAGACVACHSGAGPEQAIPGLHGRNAEELLAAMQDFKSGQRKDQIMATVAASLSDQDLDLLARYFAAQRKEGATP